MSNFNGWLIKFGEQVMPNDYLLLDGWKTTPNQRAETDAYVDANNVLHRETCEKFRTKIVMAVDELELEQKIRFQEIIDAGMINVKERKVSVTYWNDETHQYTTSPTGFYIPDIEWVIERVDEDEKNIYYKKFTIILIEY